MFSKKATTLFLVALFFGVSFFTSCDDDDTVIQKPDGIIGEALATNSLSTLVSALQKADLVTFLQNKGPFTVLAPSNDAFQALLDSKPTWNSLDDVPKSVLQSVLKYHVIEGKAKSTDLSDDQEFVTLNGEKITVDLSDGVKFSTITDQSIKVTSPDIEVSNGVIHLIDKVMLPIEVPINIVDKAISTPDLSSLVAAVQKAGLVEELVKEGAFTVFAPNNAAFQALLDSNDDWASLEDIPSDDLKSILLFHVLGDKVKSSDLADKYLNTLSTGPNEEPISLQIQTTGGVKFNGEAMPTEILDVEASNGVVHIIDKVMLPPNIVTLAVNGGFSKLAEALSRTDLSTDFLTVLKGKGPYTVFAPTDAAFDALLEILELDSVNEIPAADLEAVLRYHVVSGNVQADELSDDQVIPTLSLGNLTVDLTDGAKLETSSNQSVKIVATDVQGTNGVIHVINEVLIESSGD